MRRNTKQTSPFRPKLRNRAGAGLDLLKVATVARMLGLSEKEVWKLIDRGLLVSKRIGWKQIRVDRQSAEQWLKGMKRNEPEQAYDQCPPQARGWTPFNLEGDC